MSDETMEDAYERDRQAERLMRDAIHAIGNLMLNAEAWARLSERERGETAAAKAALQRRADHIVAVWN